MAVWSRSDRLTEDTTGAGFAGSLSRKEREPAPITGTVDRDACEAIRVRCRTLVRDVHHREPTCP